jgi:L-amino acid N-acyltransferase YncA
MRAVLGVAAVKLWGSSEVAERAAVHVLKLDQAAEALAITTFENEAAAWKMRADKARARLARVNAELKAKGVV